MKENNQLIVDFLGLEKCKLCHDCGGYHCGIVGQPTESTMLVFEPRKMHYHQKWDWLMPLVENIESIWHDDHGYFGVFISSNSCTIQGTKFRPDKSPTTAVYYDQAILDSKMESTYVAVLRFIEWYMKIK